jgi:hypothetical protein
VEKGEGEVQGTPSIQIIIAVSSGGKETELIKVEGASFFENLPSFLRANSSNRIADVLELQSGSKSCSFEGGAKW